MFSYTLNPTDLGRTIKTGRPNENATLDNISLKVKLYMNEETFVSGKIRNTTDFSLAYLEDENGINTDSGISHDVFTIL